jgi:hypothetical protein
MAFSGETREVRFITLARTVGCAMREVVAKVYVWSLASGLGAVWLCGLIAGAHLLITGSAG